MAGLRERNKQEKLDRIKAAAAELFARDGFEAVTTKQVADAAGVGTGTLFLYAKDKTELLMLVCHDRVTTSVMGAVDDLQPAPLDEQLPVLYHRLLDLYAEDTAAFAAYFDNLWTGGQCHQRRAQDSLTAFIERVAALVAQAQASGACTETHPDAATVDPLLVSWNLHALWRAVMDRLRSGIVTLEEAHDLLSRSFDLQMRALERRPL